MTSVVLSCIAIVLSVLAIVDAHIADNKYR